jgi:hypothetical protein
MKIYQIEIERTYTVLVAAESLKWAREYVQEIEDEIVRDCLDHSSWITGKDITDLAGIMDESVYCETEGIETVKQALEYEATND